MTRAQTSTEYLIISAVVIIIAVVVVGVLGGIPGIGGGTSANVNRAQLQILPVGIIEYHVGQDDTVVILRNNQQQNVVVTQILYGSQTCAVNRQITPGREIRVDCDNINSSLPLSDILVEYRVQEAIYYVSTSGSASTPPLEFEPVEPFIGWCYQESADSLVGSQENCTHLLSVGGAYAYEGDVNNPTNAWDEDWDTYANLVDPWDYGSTYLYFNYSAPDNIGSNTHFQFSMHLTTMNVT
ncbi:MAG: hypothetical protein ACMXYC_04960, partial [Candidatus Woesearchaeota archaeon]